MRICRVIIASAVAHALTGTQEVADGNCNGQQFLIQGGKVLKYDR